MQTMTFQYIFFIEDGMITVYLYRNKMRKFEYLKRDGSLSYPLTEDFWEWWRKASDYIEGDEIDFCFIYDEDNSLLSDAFLDTINSVTPSCWNMDAIRSLFEEMIDSTHIELNLPNGRVEKFDKQNLPFGGKRNAKKVYYTNIVLEEEEPAVNETMEKTPFALYFQELRRREKER